MRGDGAVNASGERRCSPVARDSGFELRHRSAIHVVIELASKVAEGTPERGVDFSAAVLVQNGDTGNVAGNTRCDRRRRSNRLCKKDGE